ncbi:hypothetical protein L484_020094 [Morus notabilis]|uniref:Uncharacterized protein n=1 Tax=Morus notabilis TaxID=981085 RepID=W9RB69_9ROSA|nr:hypothetical protein L484_020094 [Morus notabilis]
MIFSKKTSNTLQTSFVALSQDIHVKWSNERSVIPKARNCNQVQGLMDNSLETFLSNSSSEYFFPNTILQLKSALKDAIFALRSLVNELNEKANFFLPHGFKRTDFGTTKQL